MSKERYVEHTVALELPIRDSVTKGNYNLADIETKYLPIQTEVVSDNKDKTINKLQQRIAKLKKQLEEKEKEMAKLRELRAIKDDASQCVVVNGVKFSYEQILIIQDMNYNYDMKIKNLKQQLKSQPAEIVEKIRKELSLHCDYKDNIGWYMPENKFNLILDQLENEKESN